MNVDDIVGLRFGKLIVVSYSHKVKNRNKNGYSHYYNCKCDCGNNHVAERNSIKFGNTKSCGCIKTEKLIKRNSETAKYNGESRSKYARILRIYRSMCYRCYNKIDESYINYGGRGIKVCDEWLNDYFSFRNWAIDNGYSDNLSIDRIDVNGNYEPSNCRWATDKEQGNNKRNNKMIEYNGEVKTLSEWCDELDIEYFRTKARLNKCNMTPKQAFELPKQVLKRKVNI